MLTKAPWFKWDSRSLAQVVAFLESQELPLESEALLSNFSMNLNQRDLGILYCELIESYSENKLQERFVESFYKLKQIPEIPRTVRLRGYKSMILGLCELGQPIEAEEMVNEMEHEGLKPSYFELRGILYSYGQLGLFSEMHEVVDKIGKMDTVTANMVVTCLGSHGKHAELVQWLRKMREGGIAFTFRTYNSALNSCPGMMDILNDYQYPPLSMDDLWDRLGKDSYFVNELSLIKELVNSEVLDQQLKWSALEGKLDLHGLHLGSAYLILLQWMSEMRTKVSTGIGFPKEIVIICGSGKHSYVKGESPIKQLVSSMMFKMNSPLRIDRENVGRFVARGRMVKDWLHEPA